MPVNSIAAGVNTRRLLDRRGGNLQSLRMMQTFKSRSRRMSGIGGAKPTMRGMGCLTFAIHRGRIRQAG
jgi:hypothetical protein